MGNHFTGYRLRHLDDGSEEFLGDDPQIITAALFSVLDQPGVEVFTITTTGSGREGKRFVLPRHHLPAFNVHPH